MTVKIYSYECRAPSHCPACGPGLVSPADNCTSAACPGMNDARSVNCSGRGVGPHGGCELITSSDEEEEDEGGAPLQQGQRFECTCGIGHAGDACELTHDPPSFTDAVSIAAAADAAVEEGANFTYGFSASSALPDVPVAYVLEGGVPRRRVGGPPHR